jgi:outer membrane protein TolC
LEELRRLVTVQEEQLRIAQANYEAERTTRLEVCAAEVLLTEARIKLATAEQKSAITLLEDLVRSREEELGRIETLFEFGTVAKADLQSAKARLSEARIRLATARAESPGTKK